MEASWFSKYKFGGPVTRCFLDRLTANVMPRSGSVVQAASSEGIKLEGQCMITDHEAELPTHVSLDLTQ
jgi:glycine cleavage system aminomethyltransferase T